MYCCIPSPTYLYMYVYVKCCCSRLQSANPDTLLRSCHFIHDVLLEDFPAEVFLQRPDVFRVSCHSNTIMLCAVLGIGVCGGGGGGVGTQNRIVDQTVF